MGSISLTTLDTKRHQLVYAFPVSIAIEDGINAAIHPTVVSTSGKLRIELLVEGRRVRDEVQRCPYVAHYMLAVPWSQ